MQESWHLTPAETPEQSCPDNFFKFPKCIPRLNSYPLFTGFLLISGSFSRHYCIFIRPWMIVRLSTSPIPSPFSFQLERASDRRWIFSVLMSPGATDNMDSDLSASLGHHCGTKSLLLSGLPPLILCSKRNSKRTCSNSFVPCSFFDFLLVFLVCIFALYFIQSIFVL